jgi:Raf kinase inhibitor-like YbhB/YbcL family protein
MKLTSPAFAHQGPIPKKYTCEAENVSPPLEWTNVPKQAKALALMVVDPDAPDPANPQRTWVHWVIYDIPPDAEGIEEGAPSLPPGTGEGTNDWNRTGYGGPCPPIGRHRYFFTLYALDTELPDLGKPTRAQLEKAMHGHVIAQTELIGTYQKEGR